MSFATRPADAAGVDVLDQPAAQSSRDGLLEIPGRLDLHHGGALKGVRVAWRLAGAMHGPVIAVLGGISAGRDVFGSTAETGWWNPMVGSGRGVDTDRFRVLGIDFLGGSGATTGPRPGAATLFPSISSFDQAAILAHVLDHLGVERVHAIVGASYGGMVGLAFAQRFAPRVARLLVLSGAHRSHPLATAWRSIERRIVRYAAERGDSAGGLEIARALAMATYRSSAEFEQRFDGDPDWSAAGAAIFPVEQYLFARGASYARNYVPEAFVCLSESIDLHRVDPQRITTPVTLVAVAEDQLVPLADMRELARQLAGPVELIELSSIYGHDAFLKENIKLESIFKKALDSGEVQR
jgi:homoserine O-acetyltransferase